MARTPKSKAPAPNPTEGDRELIVMVRPEAGARASRSRGVESATGATVTDMRKILKDAGAVMVPLFGSDENRIIARTRSQAETAQTTLEDQSVFYKVEADDKKLEDLSDKLGKQELVEAAYVKPPVSIPIAPDEDDETDAPSARSAPPDVAPPATSDFTSRQIYLDAAPAGIDARWAWTQAGGTGNGVRIIDIEGDWRFTHEDLLDRQGGIVGGTTYSDIGWRNHGTAVLGEYSGDRNAFGITGISPDAVAMAISHGTIGSAGAINMAAARLGPGDVILLEMHRPGPRFNYQSRGDQRGYIAVEWWPDDYTAILNATRRGVIVVEAAGNGNEDLDDAIYETRPPWFPSSWRNPFRRVNRDSGAIMVGAGAPPPGTHGRDHGPDRSRLGFSNYGDIIDTQGWGREVTTCGYGFLQGGSDEDLWYTDTFSGTSSASPIITGAVASLVSMAAARGKPMPTPARLRNCFRTTGSPQQDAPGRPATQRIGTRPDMRALATCMFGSKSFLKDLKDGKERKEKEGKEFKERLKEVRKDGKEKDRKEFFEGKRFEGKRFEGFASDAGQSGGADDLSERLSALEETVSELVHFISPDKRPDLGGGYTDDPHDPKGQKDLKDSEKLSDS